MQSIHIIEYIAYADYTHYIEYIAYADYTHYIEYIAYADYTHYIEYIAYADYKSENYTIVHYRACQIKSTFLSRGQSVENYF